MATGTLSDVNGTAVYAYAGPPLRAERDASDLIGQAGFEGAALVAVPVDALDPSFFELSSGLAGAVVQKFVQYGLRLAVVGDVSPYTAGSEPLRAFVRESNRGRQLWFTDSPEELAERLG